MNRRFFLHGALRAAGYTACAGLVGAAGVVAAVQPRRHRLPPRNPRDRERPVRAEERKRVVVIGGGLGGVSAAFELAERNFEVILIERAPELGGKLSGWTVRALGEEFPIEHGFHGFFSQYYNLEDLLTRAQATADLVESPGYPVLFADRPAELFGRTTRLFPLNLLSVIRQSHGLRLADFARDPGGLAELMKYDGERTFERLDGVDFAAFCRQARINRPMVETVLEPFGRTTLNRLERLSAAEALRFFHFYFMGNPEGLGFRFTRRDAMTAVVRPLERRLHALGCRLRLGIGARRLVRGGGGVHRVVVDADPAPLETVHVAEAEVPAGAFLALPTETGASVYVGHAGGQLIALDGRCTHMGCPVAPDPATGGFRCPCHAGTFDAEGRPTGGPPRRPLGRLAVERGAGGKLTILAARSRAAEEALACDYCIVACDVGGVRRLVAASALGEPELERRVAGLGEADPYVVWRLWLDRPTRPDRRAFYTTARFRYTDSLAIYSCFQEPFISWARRTGGSVVEIHAYAIAPEAMLPPDRLRAQMRGELERLLPELGGARVLHEEYQQQSNFTRLAPGDHATRPSTETPLANLFLAGDHVRLELPAALMEAAVVSGRLAASAVLRREGLREVPVWTVAPRGPLVF